MLRGGIQLTNLHHDAGEATILAGPHGLKVLGSVLERTPVPRIHQMYLFLVVSSTGGSEPVLTAS